MTQELPTLAAYANGERKMIAKLTDNKLVVAILVPLILAIAAWVSGLTAVPANDARQDREITELKGETRTLRESGIRAEESFRYIKESLERIERKADRRERER